jgi:hypothetical protein
MPTIRDIPVGFGVVTYVFLFETDPGEMSCTTAADFSAQPSSSTADGLHAAFGTNLMPNVTNGTTLSHTQILYQLNADDQIVVVSAAAPVVGGRSESGLPQNCAFLAEKHTALAGRQNTGRMYIPGCADSDVNDIGEVSAVALAAWNADLPVFLTAFNNVLLVNQMQLLHSCFHEPLDPPCVPHEPTPITSMNLDPVIATQRRRLR